MLISSRAQSDFGVKLQSWPKSERCMNKCKWAYEGNPDWLDADEHIKTINFAKTICSEISKLVMQGTVIKTEGSARAEYIQKIIDKNYYNFRKWIEYSGAYGLVILKPSGDSIDVMFPHTDFEITDESNGDIKGAIFVNRKKEKNKYYTRYEYHRFEEDEYIITNKCYVGDSKAEENPVDISLTPWSELKEEVVIDNIDKPLFAVLGTPQANNVEPESPLTLPIYSEVLKELEDLDVAYSRNSTEVWQSKRTVLVDSDRLFSGHNTYATNDSGMRIKKMDRTRKAMGLPDVVKTIEGNSDGDIYHEINPAMFTEQRIAGINSLLSQIGFKVGFANGHFVFNESTGIQTATGVRAEQTRTVQLIKDCRDQFEECIKDLIVALNKFADLYNLAPVGEIEPAFDFGDIMYSRDEDKAMWWTYVQAGKVPFWRYLVKFEGMTEEEAKEIEKETQQERSVYDAYA